MNWMSEAAVSPLNPLSRRLRLRFGLRTLLVVLTLAGVLLAWITSAQRQREAVAALRSSNPAALVAYDFDVDDSGEAKSWIVRRLGLDYGASPARVDLVYPTDSDLAYVARLRNLRSLYLLRAIDLTDAGLAHLAALGRLQKLTIIDDLQLTDRGLAAIGRLEQLEILRLDIPRGATDAGLAELAKLKNLTELRLSFRGDVLDYPGKHISRAGIEALRRAMPGCQIAIFSDLWLALDSDVEHTPGIEILWYGTRQLGELDRRIATTH